MISILSLLVIMAQPSDASPQPKSTQLQYPRIKHYGGVVALPNAHHQPRKGTKVVFDVTAGAKPDGLNKGLERTARFANLMALGGLEKTDYQASVVLHGEATQAALNDAAYAARFDGRTNPYLPLIKLLKEAGIEIAVCGQALEARQFQADEVAREVTVVFSAVTMVIERQAEDYAYIAAP